jgi:GT2 family glycosyltransferase
MPDRPLVSVIVLNHNGLDFIAKCLPTVERTAYSPIEILVADNHSSDGSVEHVRRNHPNVRILALDDNYGYTGAYNRAVPQAKGEILAFLNNDTEVDPNWLDEPIQLLISQPRLAAVQPKLRYLQDRKLFDYSGGSGGYLDAYGYPFVRGRIFDVLEEDHGQYDDVVPILWASGAAFISKRAAFEEAGGLDGDLFMHMEELDLCWRYWLLGWEIKVAPRGVVYHYAGGALPPTAYRKMYLNHRNGIAVMLKNCEAPTLWRYLPRRILLDWITFLISPFRGQVKRSAAVLLGHGFVFFHLRAIWKKHRQTQAARKVSDRDLAHVVLPFCAVWRHFIKRQKTFSQLMAAS